MKVTADTKWVKQLQKSVEQYTFDIGILEDGDHKEAKETPRFGDPELSEYAGGPVRKTSSKPSGKSIGEVFIENMKRLNINLLLRPFEERDSDIIKFMNEFLKYVVSKPGANIRRVENLLQAVVRNPILKQEYGQNSPETADHKGFDRMMIDTAQMFKAIKAKAKRV